MNSFRATGCNLSKFTISEICLQQVPWKLDNVEAEAVMIIAVPEPLCGAVVVGQESISYITPDSHVTVPATILATSTITCYAPVDTDGRRQVPAVVLCWQWCSAISSAVPVVVQ